MSKLSLREIAQSQLDSTPVIDGQLIVCLDTGNAYRDTATAHVKIGSDLEVVSDLPLAPLAEKLYYLKPDKLYVFLGGNWTLLNDKTIDLDKVIAKLPAGSSTALNDDVEIITQDTDTTRSHYYRRKLVVLWEYIKTKAQDFFAAKNHKHGKADITDFPTSMPASDVHPWAKAATKPSYTKAEVGLGKVDNTADADKTVKRAITAGTADSANSVAWGNVKNKPATFPIEAHTHDDRYYTEAEVNSKLSGKVDNTEAGANGLINKLSTADGVPNDATVFISQHNDGKTASYYRRPISTLWTYIKSKADSVYQPKGSYAASSHSHDDRYYTEAEVDSKLSVKAESIVLAYNTNLNSITTPGFYSCGGGNSISNKPSGIDAIGLIVIHNASGSFYTQILTTSTNANTYRRTCLNGTWSAWTQDKYTDTNTWRGIQNNLTSDSTSDSLSAAQGKALKALVDGKAASGHTHQYLSLYGARPANINFTKSTNGTGTMFHFVATSSTTTGKPPADSSILQLNWDNSGGWDSQLGLSTTANPHVYYRNQQNGTWGNWSTLLDNLNYADYAAKKEHTHTKSQITDFPTSLKNPTALTIQTNGTTAATYDGSAAKTVNVTKSNIGLGNVDNTADKNKNVASAAKLTTARTVSGGSDIVLDFKYDGSANSTANIGFYLCKHPVGSTNNYPFHRFAMLTANKGAYVDSSMTFLVSQDYSGGGYGICRLVYRSNADSGSASVDAQWLVRYNFPVDTVQVAIKTDKTNGTYCDAFYKSSGTYNGVVIRAIASGGRATSGRTWTLVGSSEVNGTTATDKKTSFECWKTIAEAGTAIHKQAYSSSSSATDKGYVASAGSANSAVSCTGNSASATKLTSSAGSAVQPVYFKDGKPVAGTYSLGDASSKIVRTLGSVGNTGWANKTTDDKYVPTMSFMAYWNGAYNGGSSNLQYCDRGRFGTIVTKNTGDYAAAGHTHNTIKDISGDGSTISFSYSKAGMNYGDYTWLAGWNGYEMRAVNKNQFATAGHGHSSISTVADNRNTNTAPNDYRNTFVFQGLKYNSKINSPSSDTYSYLLGLRGWAESSGGDSHELAFNNTGVYWRHGATTGWSGWNRIYTDNYHPSADVANSVAWNNVSGKPSSYTPASHTHDDRYYTESEINTKLNGKSNTGHTHDDRYYTESEVNTKLNGKLSLSGGTMSGQIKKDTGGSWIGDRDRAVVRSHYPGDGAYGAVAGMPTKNGFWTMGALGGWEDLVFNYSTNSNYSASKNETSQVRLPAQAGTIITSATIGSQSVKYATSAGSSSTATTAAKLGRSGNTGVPMTFNWSGQGGQPTWLWGGNDSSNMYVYNPSNFSVNYANSAGNGVETSGTDYIRFSNGLQICWGDKSSGSSGGVNVFFPVPFSATPPYIGFGSITATQFTPYLKLRSNTFFTWYKEGTTFGKVCWVAIGKWK